jgi:hypothetical protein
MESTRQEGARGSTIGVSIDLKLILTGSTCFGYFSLRRTLQFSRSKLRRRGHGKPTVGIQCPERSLAPIGRWVSSYREAAGIVNLAKAFEIERDQPARRQLLAAHLDH